MRKISINVIVLNILFVVGATAICTLLFLATIRDESEHLARVEQEEGIQTFWQLLRAKGTEFKIVDGKLMAGDYVLNGNVELPDTIKSIFGSTATIFMGDTRVSTNILKENGTRATGTKLEGPAHDAIFRNNSPYRGETVILGIPYFTAYDPIRNSRGEVIGALYVGARKNDYYSRHEHYKITIIATAAAISTIFALLAVVLLRDRKLHEEALQDNEAKYRTLFESSSEGILLLDDVIFDCNEQLCRLFGGSREEIVGRSPTHFSPDLQPDGIPSDDKARQLIDAAMTGETRVFPWQHRRQDGTLVDTEVSLKALSIQGRTVLQAVVRDVTERKKAEDRIRAITESLRLSEERYRTVFESTGTAMIIVEEDTTISLANDEFVKLSGSYRAEIEGIKSWTEFVAPEFRDVLLSYHRNRRISPGSAPTTYEFDFVDRCGEIRNILSTVNMIPGTSRSIASYMDITSLKQAERLLTGEKFGLELVNSEASLDKILEFLCRLMEKQSRELRCSILLVDANGSHLQHGAAPSLPEEYNRIIDGTRIGPNIGTCGTAAFMGTLVVTGDIETDPRWVKYRALPLSHGLRACWSLPVKARNGAVLGTFAAYSTVPREPSFAELQLMERLGHLTSIAIERRQAEESLQMIRLQQQAILDNIPDLVWLKDSESRFVTVNTAFAQACGITPTEFPGKTDLDVWPTDLATLYREDDARVMASGNQVRTVEPLVDVHGKRTWIETIKMPICDETGTVIGTTGIARDISERREAEEALRESEARFRELFEQNEDAIILLSRETLDIIDANKAAEALFGRDREALNWLGPWSIIVPDDYNSFIGAIPAAGETTSFHLDGIGVVRLDGTRLIASIWGKIIRLRDTEVVYCSIRDITQRIRMEEEARITQSRLIHANKMTSLGVLVSGIAHEINNPNTFIQGNSTLVESFWRDTLPILDRHRAENGDFILGGLPFEEVERVVPRLLNGVKEGSRRISAIVNNLKDFAREDTSKTFMPISVNRIVEDSKLILSYQIHRYTDNLRLELAENLPQALGKSQQIEQVVINLLLNALQALPEKEAGVTVSTAADTAASMVSITIRDEGEGMSREVLERITEPFFSTKLERGGTGLGLSISAAIVREHNGTLKFESTPGKGTTATVTLPLAYHAGA